MLTEEELMHEHSLIVARNIRLYKALVKISTMGNSPGMAIADFAKKQLDEYGDK